MVFAQLYLIAGLLIVAGIATPLVLLLTHPRGSASLTDASNSAGSRRARTVGGVIFAVLAISSGSIIFYLGEREKSELTGRDGPTPGAPFPENAEQLETKP